MPTSVQAFAEVAARRGGVDPTDLAQVQRFYRETLPTLEPRLVLEILEELLAREGRSEGMGADPIYPGHAALPSLGASPPVPPPLLAAGWRALLRRLLRGRVRDA